MKIAILENEQKRINGHLKTFDTYIYQDVDSLLEDFKKFNIILRDNVIFLI